MNSSHYKNFKLKRLNNADIAPIVALNRTIYEIDDFGQIMVIHLNIVINLNESITIQKH